MKAKDENPWYVYILRNGAGTNIYTGATNRPAHRLEAHRGNRSGGARTTRMWGTNNAHMCMLISGFGGRRAALRFERALKNTHIKGMRGIKGRMKALHRLSKKIPPEDVRRLKLWCELDVDAYFQQPVDKERNEFLSRCGSSLFNCGVDIIPPAVKIE